MIWNPKVRARTQDKRFIQVRVARVATLRPIWSSISRPALGVVPGGTLDVRLGTRPSFIYALFAWLISRQPAVLFSHNKPATSNQPAVIFSQNKPAPAISHQPTEQAESRGRVLSRLQGRSPSWITRNES
jgi:hypothetical protein